jgi:biotin carboxyl carrier protein
LKYDITIEGTKRAVEVVRDADGRYRVTLDGRARTVDVLRPSPEALHMLIEGESWEAGVVTVGDTGRVDVGGVPHDLEIVDPRQRARGGAAGAAGGVLGTQMPGRVVRILAAVGDTVRKGQPLIVLEAMKMENELKSPADGTVVELLVSEGQTVEAGTRLLRVEA